MQQITMEISGMSCGSCVGAVRKALDAVPGAHADTVALGSATISYDATRTNPEAIAQAVRESGYEPLTDGAPSAATKAGAVPGGGCCCG
ncbi:MAG: heavy-metal-associated domain-containing protein [Gemmatimonadota bacterium]